MGIISSTFLSLAVQLAWNCQRFLDPRYRSVQSKVSSEDLSDPALCRLKSGEDTKKIDNKSEISRQMVVHRKVHEDGSRQHDDNKRIAKTRYRKRRRSSFDVALIIRSMNKNGMIPSAGHRVISSTPNTLTRQPAPVWKTSSTLISSSSASSSSSMVSSSEGEELDAETTVREVEKEREEGAVLPLKDTDGNEEMLDEKQTMTAAEEAAFRMTVGRGHFSRSKKDKFLNNLRLEKRLNDRNREFFEFAYRTHPRSLHRY